MLTDVDKAILDFEAKRFRQAGRKEAAIGEQLGMASTRYYQLLNQLIDNPDALAYSPVLINRLRRLRAQRSRREQ
ncbi:MAG: DUF3263 domain-containing protein [Jatrophihabitantaceae bacterium]